MTTMRALPLVSPPRDCLGCVVVCRGDWQGLSQRELERLEKNRQNRLLRAGSVLVDQGDVFRGVYCVRRGFLLLKCFTADGLEHSLELVGPGDLLGVELVAYSRARYPYRVEVVSPVQTCFLPREALRASESPVVLESMLRTLSRRAALATRRTLALRSGNARRRVLDLVWSWCDSYGERRADGSVELAVPMRQQDLASLIGVAPETISRLLTRLAAEHLLSMTRRGFFVPDLHRLAAERAVQEPERLRRLGG